ncbi:MAG: chemotaxis-specific protein-glutamate methyltransferase CheB [Nitrospirales bacterium]|nr:chemotaxis-specific protein-glutamate methyltransferase CheB [Nitrospirales bacterium]
MIKPNHEPVRVLLVDDSLLAITILKRILSASPEIHVVGTAKNGREALELVPQVNPDVICTDLHMPVMDGLELTKEVMQKFPMPILVVSVSVLEGSENVFKLLEAGAVDVFLKPRGGDEADFERIGQDLVSRIKILSGVTVFRKHPRGMSAPPRAFPSLQTKTVHIVAVGASTGGPQTLQRIFTQIPSNFPVPVICIQHIGDEFARGLVDWLAPQCKARILMAPSGDLPAPGTVYFPQPGTHLTIDKQGRLFSSNGPAIGGHRPSIDVMFSSVAEHFGPAGMGILLTGMGKDGAKGLLAISRAGGITISQNEESSIVFGMPKAAMELGAAMYVLSPDEIARMLLQIR